MQKIDRNELAKFNVAGGCCKSSCSTSKGCKTTTGGNGGNPLPTTAK